MITGANKLSRLEIATFPRLPTTSIPGSALSPKLPTPSGGMEDLIFRTIQVLRYATHRLPLRLYRQLCRTL